MLHVDPATTANAVHVSGTRQRNPFAASATLILDAVAVCRCTSQDAAASEEATTELRSYQQRALDQIKSGGNYILVAPTGAGLTCIPQNHAK